MSERKLSELPVIDERRIPLGLLDITDVLQRFDDADAEQSVSEQRERRAA
jgi:CBS domain-containing protein